MLNKIYISKTQESHHIFAEKYFDTSDPISWIVSDLTSKLTFQKKIFEQQDLIPDETLLRAQEFWFQLFTRFYPEYKIASKECSLFFVKKFILETEHTWAHRSGTAQLALQYLNTLMPLLVHADHFELMKEFFTQQVPSFERWGHWYLLCHEIYQKFLNFKLIHPQWIPAHLLQVDSMHWEQKVYFDLGAQLQPIEAELILHLSRSMDVTVLIPKNKWTHQFQATLRSYDLFETLQVEATPPDFLFHYEHTAPERRLSFKKVPTQLSEIQDCVSEIRKAVAETALNLNEIAIAAPDMGVYWPVLSSYLKIEGIPAARGLTSTLKTLPSFHQWIARLKIENLDSDFSDIETDFYSDANADIPYAEFRSQLKNMYSLSELDKWNSLKIKYQNKNFLQKEIELVEFLEWSLPYWKQQNTEVLQSLIQRLYQDFPQHIRFQRSIWIQVLDFLSSRVEICVEEASQNGVQCLDIVSLKDLKVKKVFLLGLSDSGLRKSTPTLLHDFDVQFLKNQYGIHLSDVEKSDLEFEVFWNLQDTEKKYDLYFSQADFESNQLAPSRVWFLGAVEQHEGKIPLHTVADSRLSVQQLCFAAETTEEMLHNKDLFSKRILRDLGEWHSPWFEDRRPERLSASQIEDYLKCPFINASKKLYSLVDLPQLDLDVDFLTRGNVLHKAAEIIFKEYADLSSADMHLSEILDRASQDYQSQIKDPILWTYQKRNYELMLRKFIHFEQQLKIDFPELQPKYIEDSFSVCIDPYTGDLDSKESSGQDVESKGKVLLRGRLDRVDVDQRNELSVIVDYKYSFRDLKNFNTWIDDNKIQLLLYMYAVEKGVLKQNYRVIGAFYYGFKEGLRAKGFLDKEVDGVLFKSDASRNKTTADVKEQLYIQLKEKIVAVIQNMSAGQFEPQPEDVDDCKKCRWRTLCRAPHLN